VEAEHKMTTRIKLRRDTAANWTTTDPILAVGEPGLESDTSRIKYGDGETAWSQLAYGNSGSSLNDSGDVVVTAGSTEHWIATQRRNSENTRPRGLRYDSLGNLYALTQSAEASGDYIAIITKYTALGSIVWQKSFTNVYPIALAVDSNDCAYITLNNSEPYLTIIKFSTTGTLLWKKDYDVGINTESFDAFIEEKSSTTLVLAFTAYNGGEDFVVVTEISSSDGTVDIKRQLELSNANVRVTGIDVDPDQNVFVTGHYYDDPDDKDKMFIEKLNSDLGPIWSKSLENPTNNGYSMYGGDCASDALGNIYVVGTYSVNTNNDWDGNTNKSAAVLVKLNSSGAVQWTRRIGPGPCGSFIVGLTVTDIGDVYLASATFTKNSDGNQQSEFFQEVFGDNKLLVARHDTQGTVIWQRYVDVTNLYENFSDEDVRGQAIAVFGNKFVIDGYGLSQDSAPIRDSGSDDFEDDYFVVQLPTDGTALTIGNLNFTESRVPGRFVTHVATNSPLNNIVYAETILAEDSALTADAEARIANSIVNSDTYDYTFGADGTLTIPNDGDLRLTQNQVGYLMAVGGSFNGNGSVYGRAVTVDAQGNMYVVGEDQNNQEPFVTKISPEGDRLWGVTIGDDDAGHNGRANGITVHPTTGNVMVVCEMYGANTYSILVTLDQDTGRMLDHDKFSDAESDVYLTDIAYTSTGNYVMAGSIDGDFTEEFPVTKQTGSTTGTIVILRSAIDSPPYSWQIGGTGIDPFENVLYVERYTGLTGTVRQGSGATFNITIDGGGAISGSSVAAGGTNYLVGHKILLNRAPWEGVDLNSDIIVTVTSAPNGVIDGIAVGYYGGGSGLEGSYPALSGTNYQTGSGLEITFEGPRDDLNYNEYYNWTITTPGTNYQNDDVVVIAGTSLGGTSPANDLTLTVIADSGGIVDLVTLSGTAQSTTWKLNTTTQVDFSGSGSWSITYPVSRQNLLITPTWQRTFGTGESDVDRLYAVAIDTSNNIIAVGEGRGDLDQANDSYSLAMVYKFSSTGTLEWARQLNETNYDCYAKSVVTVGTDIYVTHDSIDNGDTVVTKLDATGTVKWQRITSSAGPFGNGDDSVIAATQDGNLLVAAEGYNDDIEQTVLKVFLLTPSGETVYKRWLMASSDEYIQFKNGRGMVADSDSFYITGYFDANNYRSSLVSRLPIDGSGVGNYGSFRYTDVNALTNTFFGDTLTGVNYSINEVDLADVDNYAGIVDSGTNVYVKTTNTVTVGTGDFYVDSFYPAVTLETVRDTDGGSIIFPDGTKQNTSATDIPQRRYTGQKYTLGLKDRGHHILCDDANSDSIMIPYNARVEFPIGAVITIVNITGGTVNIYQEGTSLNLYVAGYTSGEVYGVDLEDGGMATLLKIERDSWIISGNVTVNEGP